GEGLRCCAPPRRQGKHIGNTSQAVSISGNEWQRVANLATRFLKKKSVGAAAPPYVSHRRISPFLQRLFMTSDAPLTSYAPAYERPSLAETVAHLRNSQNSCGVFHFPNEFLSASLVGFPLALPLLGFAQFLFHGRANCGNLRAKSRPPRRSSASASSRISRSSSLFSLAAALVVFSSLYVLYTLSFSFLEGETSALSFL